MNDPDTKKSTAKPFRRAVLTGLGVFLPPLLTLAVFLWAWSTIQRYVLEPVEWGARSIIVWQSAEILDQPPLVQDETALVERDSNGDPIKFQKNDKLFVQIPSGKWIPDQIVDTVRKDPGKLSLNTANANQYYHQYIMQQFEIQHYSDLVCCYLNR